MTWGDGPLLVVAGAGTGKTTVLTRRIAWLIAEQRAKPSEILALTFTERAAAEMQERVDQLVPYGYADSVICTFHAFGDVSSVRRVRGRAGDQVAVMSRPSSYFLREHLDGPLDDTARRDPTLLLWSGHALFAGSRRGGVTGQYRAPRANRRARPATLRRGVARRRAQARAGAATKRTRAPARG